MVTCPRCQQPVDETVRSTCPLCFTPIPQANQAGQPLGKSLDPPVPLTGLPLHGYSPTPNAAASYPQPPVQTPNGASVYPQSPVPMPGPPPIPMPAASRPTAGPGARTSLTGDIIESGAPGGPQSYAGGPPLTAPRSTAPGAPARPTAPVRRSQEAAPTRAGGSVVATVITLIVLLAAAAAGWYYWMHRTNPKDQALAVFKAYVGQDFKTAYGLSALGPEALKAFPDADSFAADQERKIKSAFGNSALLDLLKSAADSASVGEPVVNGDKAEVPTSCQLSALGRTVKLNGTAHMINDFGIWKLDMRTDDVGKANKVAIDMVGKPDMSGLGGR